MDLCILYGSAALDRLSPSSDIDIAVGSKKSLSNDYCIELSRKLSLITDREVSIINIEKMEGIILQEVLVKGITLKNSEPNYKAGFLSKMYEYTEDILPYQMMGINNKLDVFLNE
ncbi:MAG: nucleotidyltransferase domain-containing protein [Spirochaetaceae bacterium]|nr:nucleotidyltransferase domain-containing protein [Spirochaetaceae bacterium]